MPLDIPLVPVNTDVKVAAMSALVQSIGDLQKFQSAPAANAGAAKTQTDADKKEDELAKKAAARSILDEKLPGQPEAAPGAVPQATTTPTSSGMSGLQFQEAGGSPGTGGSSLGFGSDIPVFGLQ